MESHIKIPQYQHRWSIRFGARWLLSVMLGITILLGQTIPLMAGHSSDSPQGWVEICGEGGSYFIQIGADGQEQAPQCVHCDTCLIPSGDAPGIQTKAPALATLVDFMQINHSEYQPVLPVNPEQYWSACRGPPIASAKYNMTTLAYLIQKTPTVTVLNTWETPCV